MKKLKILIISIMFFLASDIKALSCDKVYLVQTASSTGVSEYIGCTDDYEEALSLMREYPSTKTDVAAIYKENVLINARYALVSFSGKGDGIKVYDKPSLSTQRSYIAGDWGADGVFLDYNQGKSAIKIKISGLVGWIKSTQAEIIPLSDFYAKTVLANQTIRVRTEPVYDKTNNNQISQVPASSTWIYVDKVEADGYLWYKIIFNDSYAYIAGKKSCHWNNICN